MERNLDRRVEALCRVGDREVAEHLRQVVLEAYLADTHRAYVLHGDEYGRVAGEGPGFNAQEHLLDWYRTHPSASADDDRPDGIIR